MGSELIPSEGTPSALETFTDKLNLPALIAGPAGKAISRLVAGVVEIPAAYLNSFAQGIKDKTHAKTVVNSEVANAAAKLASGDNEIVARAAHNLLAKEYRKQKNKEDISRLTVEILQGEAKLLPPPPEAVQPPPPEVDPDWLNVFERFAEDASTERMQSVWAKILAGEIRKPKTFSLATLRFIAEVDERTASLFQKHAAGVMDGQFIPFTEHEGDIFTELLELQNAGLLMGVGGQLAKIFKLPAQPIRFLFKHTSLLVFLDKDVTIRVTSVLLTRIGQELYSITECGDGRPKAVVVANELPKDGVTQIFYANTAGTPELLWKREVPDQKDAPT